MTPKKTDLNSVVNNLIVLRFDNPGWGGLKLDKEAGAKLAREMHANEKAYKVQKNFTGFHPTVTAMEALMGEVRNRVRDTTLAYGVRGMYLVTSQRIQDLMTYLTQREMDFNDLLERICETEYDDIKAAARVQLGNGWNEYSFPTKGELRAKYGFAFHFLPLPAMGDPIRGLAEDVQAQVWEQTETAMRETLNDAMADLFKKVDGFVSRMVEMLRRDREVNGEIKASSFHQTLVTNVVEAGELLISLNPYEDKTLDKLGRDIKAKLGKHSAETLKNDPVLRTQVADEAELMLKKLRGLKTAA
jgi:hypothetical protein